MNTPPCRVGLSGYGKCALLGGAGYEQLFQKCRSRWRCVGAVLYCAGKQDVVLPVQIVGGNVNMEPLSVCVDKVPRMVGGADGEAGLGR